jgi:hypothetical protein
VAHSSLPQLLALKHLRRVTLHIRIWWWCVCVCVCVATIARTCTRTHECIHTCIHISLCSRTHTHTHTHTLREHIGSNTVTFVIKLLHTQIVVVNTKHYDHYLCMQ